MADRAARGQVRWPPFQVVPYGDRFMLRCSECGDVSDHVYSLKDGRQQGREHQREQHPTEDERAEDELVAFEWSEHMDGYCSRCGIEGHCGSACPTITPDLLRRSHAE